MTWALILGTVAVMLTFEDTITTFLTYADAIGRAASSEMVFSGEGMNLFRVAVYGVVPVASLLFRPILEPQMERRHYLLLHMSIVSFMFMLLASINGANMFGRMARYFELGDGVHVPLDHTPPLQQAVPAAGRGGLRVRLPPLPGLRVLGF